MKKKNGLFIPDSTEVLSCKILHAKLKCQKTPKENDVRKLASAWEDKLCDPIHVSYRDGQYGIVEGQKRKLAKMMVDSDGTVICHIYRDMTEQDEYQLFSQLNNGKRTYGTSEDYEARLQFDPKWQYITKCAKEFGFSIIYSGVAKDNTFACAPTIEEIYDRLGDIDFVEMLKLLRKVCEGNKYSLQASFLKGFAKFYYIYKSSIVEKELKKVFMDKSTKIISKSCFDKIKEKSDTYTSAKNVGVKMAFGLLLRYNDCCLKKNKLSFGAFDDLSK